MRETSHTHFHARIRPLALAAVACLAAVLALPSAASASRTQQTMLQDDQRLIFSDAGTRGATLDEFQSLGVDIAKIRIDWRAIAPSPDSNDKPGGFTGDNPSEYGDKWAPYDEAISGAKARGMQVLVQLGGNAPDWAGNGRGGVSNPNAEEFGRFVKAVGARYGSSGTYVDPTSQVSMFAIWNEPELDSWLKPQYRDRRTPMSPHIYRGLYLAAVGALNETGHGNDTILYGELAPFARGGTYPRKVRPLHFLREFACLDRRYRPFRGSAARKRNCDGFSALPGTGLSYHPYTLAGGPRIRQPNRDDASIGELSRIVSALNKIGKRGRFVNAKPNIYITEFGYQSDPPDRVQTRISRIPAFMGEAEWLAFRNSRVATYSQYPLVDDSGLAGFQSGLRFKNGKEKGGVYRAFQLPFFVRLQSSSRVELFGGVRAGKAGDQVTVEVRNGRRYRTLRTITLGDQGYFDVKNVGASAARSSYFRLRSGSLVSKPIKPVSR